MTINAVNQRRVDAEAGEVLTRLHALDECALRRGDRGAVVGDGGGGEARCGAALWDGVGGYVRRAKLARGGLGVDYASVGGGEGSSK